MADNNIRFDNGAAYERMMGVWSRLPGAVFLDWLAPGPALRWLDVGCGAGAFTELIAERSAPIEVQGVDASPEQIAFAQARLSTRQATFALGDALALPYPDDRFDAAAMALVIFFLPDPAQGAREMARVVRPGGIVAAYAWDIIGGGSPLEPIRAEQRALGLTPTNAPADDASRTETMRDLWREAGLIEVETRQITVERTFGSFEDFWRITLEGSIIGPGIARLAEGDRERLKDRVRAQLGTDAQGRVRCTARANAVKGLVEA